MKRAEWYRGLIYAAIVSAAGGALWAGSRYDVSQRLMNRAFVLLGWGETGSFEPSPASSVEPGATEPRGEVALDARRRQLIGVQTVLVEQRTLDRTVRATGIVKPDERRLVDVNVRLAGWIRQLGVESTGRFVRQGDPLFTLYSPELAATEQEYLLARTSRDELGSGATSEARTYADRLVEAAERRLGRWDVSPEQIAQIADRSDASGQIVLRSPASGYVVEKAAVEGMHVEQGQTLYRIADFSVVWLEASIYEQDLPFVHVGQQASIVFEAVPDGELAGRVVYILPSIEQETRTARVRVELPNRSGALKPGMFATATLHVPAQSGLVVPENAVLDSGTRQFVFVDAAQGHFEPREVKTGSRASGQVQVLSGLHAGDRVASSSVFLIDSESQLRGALEAFQAAPAAVPAASRPAITFHSNPEPARVGENTFEVTVGDAAANPIDADRVDVTFFMPAMPTMSMPALRDQFVVSRVGPGRYRGIRTIPMAGRWQVTVTATRGADRIGSLDTTLVAQ